MIRTVTDKTLKISNISYDFEVDYGFNVSSEQRYVQRERYYIQSFWSLGLADPFPDEATTIDEQFQLIGTEKILLDKFVYPDVWYESQWSPQMIYLPTRIIMMKMMRGCMGCDSKSDLWVFRK